MIAPDKRGRAQAEKNTEPEQDTRQAEANPGGRGSLQGRLLASELGLDAPYQVVKVLPFHGLLPLVAWIARLTR